MYIKARHRVDARRGNTISTSGRLFTRMREPCNGIDRVRQRPGSSARNTLGTPPLMAIKLPENHARLSARCHIRSFPLTGSYEAVISEREGTSFTLSPLYLLVPYTFPFPRICRRRPPLCSTVIPLPHRYRHRHRRTGLAVSCPRMETPSTTKLKLRPRWTHKSFLQNC